MNEQLYYITINPDDWTTCGIYQGNKDDLSFVMREGLDVFHSSNNGKQKWAWTCDKDKAIEMYKDEMEKIIERHEELLWGLQKILNFYLEKWEGINNADK